MLNKYTNADFAPHVGEPFSLSIAPWGQPHDTALHGELRTLTLIEVTADQTDNALAHSASHIFSLLFRASDTTYLPQRTYTLNHTTLGQIDLFLVPIGPDHIGMRYQAIFT